MGRIACFYAVSLYNCMNTLANVGEGEMQQSAVKAAFLRTFTNTTALISDFILLILKLIWQRKYNNC